MPVFLPSETDLRRNLPDVAIQMIYQGVAQELKNNPSNVELQAWMTTMSPSMMTPHEMKAVLHATMSLRDKPWRTAWYHSAHASISKRAAGQDVDAFLKGLEPIEPAKAAVKLI